MSTLHRISNDGSFQADVVFVHGLGGDAFSTWRHGDDESTSWPHWLAEENRQVCVWSLGYAASPTKLTGWKRWFNRGTRDDGEAMPLVHRAAQTLNLMGQKGLGERPLLFICHSLGGLVAKQILRKSFEGAHGEGSRRIFENTRAVLFLATPHSGAKLATLATRFEAAFRTTVSIADLREHDVHLEDLFEWYGTQAPKGGIETRAYCEARPTGLLGVVVNATSARAGAGPAPVPLDETHITIAKPRERDAQVCLAAAELLRDYVLRPRVRAAAARPAAARAPHELPPMAVEFFGRQAELDQLIRRLGAGRSTAVIGAAGLGKTALAAKALQAVVGESPETLARSPFPDGVVYLDLYAFQGQADPAWDRLANRLEGAEFLERRPSRARAENACGGKRALVVIEGGEQADGLEGRVAMEEFLYFLSTENRWLLLTRQASQALPTESVNVDTPLSADEAARLFDSLAGSGVDAKVRARVLALLDGHPLAISWAGGLLARNDEEPEALAAAWAAEGLPGLRDPKRADRTLRWLFERSARGMGAAERIALAAAALLARAPFPLTAIEAVLPGGSAGREALAALANRSLLRRLKETLPPSQISHRHSLL